MQKNLFLGIDIGSITLKVVVLDSDKRLCYEAYARMKGNPLRSLERELHALAKAIPENRIRAAGITGSGGKQAAGLIGAAFTNEILSQAAFASSFHPDARTIIEMGGEDAKLIMLERDDERCRTTITDFSMNAACAAGTGSFLDQQASRLHLTIEEFSSIALRSKTPPRVAGRCSVFAKSDMIHLQQIGTPDYDIVAGLCYAMARNFKATVGKGKKFHTPLLFLGGVAANLGMRRAFRDVLNLSENEMQTPKHFNTSGAVGAALMVMRQVLEEGRGTAYCGAGALSALLVAEEKCVPSTLALLINPKHILPNPDHDSTPGEGAYTDAYLGVDVGSVSTNVVVIDRDLRVLAKRYLPTAGRPLEAVKQGLAEIGAELGARVCIKSVGTTGSGRHLTGHMIGADVVRNEITAQAAAAAAIDPLVDTIFEIGGQDSKYISLRNSAVVDFEMNKACAAGTGSFLEEQAEQLGIRIKQEFAERAFKAAAPCKFGERCTVFMESDLVHAMNTGAGTDDLAAGLAYSIVYNYLNKVVAHRHVGERIFFQGGVAANNAVVAAFEQVTGKRIMVPPHHEVTGAIGAAILALRERTETTAFKGFDLSNRAYSATSFECAECSNACDVRRVSFDNERPLFYGSRCEKYDVKKNTAGPEDVQDLFALRESLIATEETGPLIKGKPSIGIPRMLYVNDYLPFWRTFFSELGYRVVLSERTNRKLINRAIEMTVAETCFPAKIALGHIQDLLDKKVELLFLPSFIRFPAAQAKSKNAQACPYAQALPYIAKASIQFGGTRAIEPVLHLQDERHFKKSMRALGRLLGKSGASIKRAEQRALLAQEQVAGAFEEQGRELLASLQPDEKALVLVGRNYNTCDAGANMNLPTKIRELGVRAIPMDFLPLKSVDLSGHENMYWMSGQKIIAAGKFIREHPNLFPVYITNFGCGPDSFITHFFQREMGGKPFLQLEIDEHSADAGAITRIEAFMDSLKNHERAKPRAFPPVTGRSNKQLRSRKVLFPRMTDHALAVAAACRAGGMEGEVLPAPDRETLRIGREFSSGRECYPLALTTGDMVKAVRNPGFDPDRTAFFMPSGKGPCRFGQYHRYHRQVLDRLGLNQVEILAPMQDESMHDQVRMFDKDFVLMSWRGALAVDLLQKALWEHRPYEKQQGRSEAVYQAALNRVVAGVEQRKDLLPILKGAYEDFSGIKLLERAKPVIGVVGEIYIRSNQFSNEDVVRQIEALGGEAWVAPVSEWLLYLNATAKVSAKMKRAWKALLKTYLTEHVQHRDERRFLSGFNGTLRSLREPSIEQTLRVAGPYIHHSFEGEAVLSVGKAIDYINRGVSGIVNVMPFTCMPGTIASAVLKRVQEDHNNIPLLTIAYDGQGDSQTLTRLEAFMHQAKAYQQTKKG